MARSVYLKNGREQLVGVAVILRRRTEEPAFRRRPWLTLAAEMTMSSSTVALRLKRSQGQKWGRQQDQRCRVWVA